MKHLTRSITLALTLMLLLGLVGTSFADEGECFGLGEEDCELYYELSASAEHPLSSAFAINMEIAAAVTEADSTEEFEMALFLNGAYVVDVEAIEATVEAFGETPVLDVSARTFLDLARGTVSGFDIELELDYEFPPSMEIPPLGPFNVWLVDGVAYMDLAPFAAFDPTLEGVYGVDLFDLIEVPLQDILIGDLFAGLEGMGGSSSDPFGMNSQGMGDNPFANSFASANISPEDVGTFFSIERVADDSVDGTDVAVFVTTIDISAAMELDAIVASSYQSASQAGLPEDIDEAAFGKAIAESVTGSIIITEKIDLETGYGLQVTIAGDMNIDVAPFAALTGEQEEGTVTMTFTLDYVASDVNNVDAIEVPEDAEIIPVEALLGGF